MKTLTLTQPWATLVALRAKTIETRSWKTSYRGPIAIHAAKGFPRSAKEFSIGPECYRAVMEYSTSADKARYQRGDFVYPRGFVLAIADLVEILPTDSPKLKLSDQEKTFGDYSLGRYAWILENVRRLPTPDPARGSLGFWNWDSELYWQYREDFGKNGDATTPGFFTS